MGSSQDSFLFVNKDVSSFTLSRSSATENSRILTHVHQRRKHTHKDQSWRKFVSYLPAASDTEEKETRNNISLLQRYPGNNAVDPFHCTVAATDAGAHSLLDLTFTFAAKSTFLAEAYAPHFIVDGRGSMRHDNTILLRKRRCVDHPALMYSTLAYGSSCLGWMTGAIDKLQSPEFFMDKALRLVRFQFPYIVSKADTWCLLSIYALAITELWNGLPNIWGKCPRRQTAILQNGGSYALKASKTHLEALLRLVQQSGGWGAVDPYLMESAILADKYLSFALATRPIMDPQAWDPGPFPKRMGDKFLFSHERLPAAGRLLLKVAVREDLRNILVDVISYIRIALVSWSSPGQMRGTDAESWLFLRLQALIFKLQNLRALETVDECIQVMLTILLLETTHYHGSRVCALMVMQRLHPILLGLSVTADRDFLFWCFCTLAMSHEPSPERDWWTKELADLSVRIGCERTENAFAARLEPYLYVPDMQKAQLCSTIKRLP